MMTYRVSAVAESKQLSMVSTTFHIQALGVCAVIVLFLFYVLMHQTASILQDLCMSLYPHLS